jgi:hypothetical protein
MTLARRKLLLAIVVAGGWYVDREGSDYRRRVRCSTRNLRRGVRCELARIARQQRDHVLVERGTACHRGAGGLSGIPFADGSDTFRFRWFDPAHCVTGRVLEIPWDAEQTYGYLVIDDATGTIFLYTAHS